MGLYSILKAVSMLATGIFGVIGVLTTYKDKEGRVTKWGKIAIAGIALSVTLSLLLYGFEAARATQQANNAKSQYEDTNKKLELALAESRANLEKSYDLEERLKTTASSLEDVNAISQELAREQASSIRAQVAMLAAGNRLRMWQIRSSYPLAPMAIVYTATISMDGDGMTKYRNRLLLAWLGRATERDFPPGFDLWSMIDFNPYAEPEKLIDLAAMSDDDFHLVAQDLPDPKKDGPGVENLIDANWVFMFSDKSDGEEVKFYCSPSLRMYSNTSCAIYMRANFSRRQFVQYVKCEGLEPKGDSLVMSPLDLVGRRLTWESIGEGEGENWRLSKIGFVFPRQLEDPVEIDVSKYREGDEVTLTPEMLNVERILDSARPLH